MSIDDAVDKGKTIILKAYSVSESIEHLLKIVLTKILEKYKCDILLIPLYTSIKELLVNAVKANQKYIYFEGKKSYDSIFVDSDKALQLFRLEMTRKDIKHLDQLARYHNMYALITINVIDKNLCVDIENPTPMNDTEKEAVKKKLQIAQRCNDITDYFLEVHDDDYKEGAGLGLVLVTMMLKGMGLSQSNFIIDSTIDKTIVSLIVPLTEKTLTEYQKRVADITPNVA